MRILSMSEAIKKSNLNKDGLPTGSPFLDHDDERWKQMNQTGEDEKAYYLRIYDWLSPLQKQVCSQHARDLANAYKKRKSFGAQIQASQTYQLMRSAIQLGQCAFIIIAGSPFCMLSRPLNTFYMVFWFGTLSIGMFFINIAFLVGHVMGVGKLIRMIGEYQASGWSPINWLDINLFNNKRRVFDNARDCFSSDLADFEPVYRLNKVYPKRRKLQFNVDVARSILLMSSVVYERDVTFVRQAANAALSAPPLDDKDDEPTPNASVLYLLKSEEYMYRQAAAWGLKFVSISDFRSLSGTFAGAFYDFDVGPDANPYVVIVIKGTSPDNFSEFLMDCACQFDKAADYLATGLVHNGFYNALFPSKSSGAHVLPYTRILETVKMIARHAASHTERLFGTPKKTNVFIGGHSLGAAISQLLYARFLESPEDLGPQVVLRDAYVFGTPRACDFKLASRFEFNLNKPINQGRQMWRVANRAQSSIIGDIVTRVPPGFADQRETHSGLIEGSYFSYAAIGTRVDLNPKALSPPFYFIGNSPIGCKIEVYKKAEEAENEFSQSRESSKYFWPQDFAQLSMWIITVCIPILHDHFPASYMSSLSKMQARTSDDKLKKKQDIRPFKEVPELFGYESAVKDAPVTINLRPSRDTVG